MATRGAGFVDQHKPFRGQYIQRGGGSSCCRTILGRGSAPLIYRGRYLQTGSGLGSFLLGLFRKFAPALKTGAKKLFKTGMRAAASDTGQKVIGDAKKNLKRAAKNALVRGLKGENVVEGAKQDLKKAKKDIAAAIEGGDSEAATASAKKGGGKGRKKKSCSTSCGASDGWAVLQKGTTSTGGQKRKKSGAGFPPASGTGRDAAQVLKTLCASVDGEQTVIPINKAERREPKLLNPAGVAELREVQRRKRLKIPPRALI